MKYHTIRSEKFNTRCNGSYATYPVYNHITGKEEYHLECYSTDVNLRIAELNKGNDAGFFKIERNNA